MRDTLRVILSLTNAGFRLPFVVLAALCAAAAAATPCIVLGEADGHANHQQIFSFLTDLPKDKLPAYQDAARELKKARRDGARADVEEALPPQPRHGQPRRAV